MPNLYSTTDAEIASGAQVSDAVQIFGADGIALELPTFTAGLNTASASIYLTGSETATGTFRPIYAMGVYSGLSGLGLWEIPLGAGNYTVQCGEVSKQLPKFIKVNIQGTNATATAAGYTAVVHVYK
jgi:hypothetical protein